MRCRPVGFEPLRMPIFIQRRAQRARQVPTEAHGIRTREAACRLDPDGAHGVEQQSPNKSDPGADRQGIRSPHRRKSEERFLIPRRIANRLQEPHSREASQQRHRPGRRRSTTISTVAAP